MMTLGIDPGASGAACILPPVGDVGIKILDFKKMTDHEIAAELRAIHGSANLLNRISHAVLEKVHSFPGQGVSSTFKFGERYGFVRGVLTALRIPYELVTPQKWQRSLGLIIKGRAKLTGPEKKRENKAMAQRLFPDLIVPKGPRYSGINLRTADALLIAEYGRRLRGERSR